MEKYTRRNYNPQKKNTGDCVIRAFTAYFDNELDYETIKKEIVKYEKHNRRNAYGFSWNFQKFANECGLVRVDTDKSFTDMEISTYNRAIMFAKQFKVAMICISNTHAAYIDHKLGLVDTWDSRGKHLNYFYIHRDDAELLGLNIIEYKEDKEIPEVDYRQTYFKMKGKSFELVKTGRKRIKSNRHK